MIIIAFVDELAADLARFITYYGTTIKIDILTPTFNAGSYDVGTFAKSGTTQTVSGLVLPVSATDNEDSKFIQDGQITLQDKKMYLSSGVQISQTSNVVTHAGSFTPLSILNQQIGAGSIYSKVYLRSVLP